MAAVDLTEQGFADPGTYNLGGILDEHLVDPYVGMAYRNLVEGQQYLYTPEGIGELKRAMRSIINWWRPAATISRPNFHMRNAISGVANGLLVGVNARDYARFMPQYTKFSRALHAAKDKGASTVDELINAVDAEWRPVFRAMIEQDVLSTGFVRSDISQAVSRGHMSLNPANKDTFALFRMGGMTMETMEDVLRGAVFAKYFDPNMAEESASFARQMVMTVHFDYQNLTMMERRFKTIAPFFIWTRRNVPLQLRALVEKPGYAQTFNHFSAAMNQNFGDDDYRNSPLPSYYGALAMPIGMMQDDSDDTWARFIWDPDLPLNNLDDLPIFDRESSGLLPINFNKALSPMAWVNYTAELLGPQFSIPTDWIGNDGEAGYRTNAPAGLNEIGLLLENIDFFDLIDAEGSDWRWNSFQSDLFNTAVPFYKDYTGAIENNPTRASHLGLDNDNGVMDRAFAEAFALTGGGAGLKLQTPSDAKSASYEASEDMRNLNRILQERMGDNPLDYND